MRTGRVLPRLARELGKPVLTANQVTVWEAARLAGLDGARADADAGQFLVGDMLPQGPAR
jgi:maleate cis-trans isomerase